MTVGSRTSLQQRTFVTTQRNKNRALDVLASDCAVRACRKKEQTEKTTERTTEKTYLVMPLLKTLFASNHDKSTQILFT